MNDVEIENPITRNRHRKPLLVVQEFQIIRTPEYHTAGIWDGVDDPQRTSDLVMGGLNVRRLPLLRVDFTHIILETAFIHGGFVFIHENAIRIGQKNRLVLERLHERVKEILVTKVVAFSYPDQFTRGKLDSFGPLAKDTARVRLVIHSTRDIRVSACIVVENLMAVIRRAVIHKDDLDILVRLVVNAVQTPGKEFCVIVIRYDDGDLG